MMLRKRTRSNQKNQEMGELTSDTISESYSQSNVLIQKHKPNSFFHVPGLFVGLSPKNSESDSVWSPTSPLDLRVFSNIGNPFRSPRKSWDCKKVGLSIVDSLDDDTEKSGKVLRSSGSKNILFGPQMRIKSPDFGTHVGPFEEARSLPKNYAISHSTQIKQSNLQKGNSSLEPFGKILSCSLDSGTSGSRLTSLTNLNPNSNLVNFCSENGRVSVNSPSRFMGGSGNFGNISGTDLNSIPISSGPENGIFGSLSASEIKLSEDYTCVQKHGSNPKTIHIFGDCILECHDNELTDFSKMDGKEIEIPSAEEIICSDVLPPYPLNDFLSFCYSCKKELEGEDIYMYRGEKAFCSWTCRSEEILIEEAMEKETITDSPESNNCEELFETRMFIAS